MYYSSIEITHLERVKNDKDAKGPNLSAKGTLHTLSMSWDDDEPHKYDSKEVKVLESLKPHSNLAFLKNLWLQRNQSPSVDESLSFEKCCRYKNCRLQKLLVHTHTHARTHARARTHTHIK